MNLKVKGTFLAWILVATHVQGNWLRNCLVELNIVPSRACVPDLRVHKEPRPYPFRRGSISRQLQRALDEVSSIRYAKCPRTNLCRSDAIRARADRILGFHLAPEIAHGGFKRVFVDPRDPKKVIKLYDPSISREPDRAVSAHLQRELALHAYLSSNGIRVARIESTPDLWPFGILVQERIHGQTPMRILGNTLQLGRVSLLLSQLRKLNDEVHQALWERFNGYEIQLIPRLYPHPDLQPLGRFYSAGIDVGVNFENILVPDDGSEPVLIDW